MSLAQNSRCNKVYIETDELMINTMRTILKHLIEIHFIVMHM